MKIISTLLLLGALLTGAYAQRPRSADPQPSTAPLTPRAEYGEAVGGCHLIQRGGGITK